MLISYKLYEPDVYEYILLYMYISAENGRRENENNIRILMYLIDELLSLIDCALFACKLLNV